MSAVQQVRGTQSFVSVMSEVWRRPSLSVLEIVWRWAVSAPILVLAIFESTRFMHSITLNTAALEAMTVFQPVAAFRTIDATMAAVLPGARPVALWLLPLAVAAWLLVAALGRTVVLRRFDRTLHARPLALLALGTLRAILLTAVWMLWFGLIARAGSVAITGPAAQGGEPNIVLYAAIMICGTLVLYVLWGIFSWPLYLAPLLALERNLGTVAALGSALRSSRVRGKLIEINLVMNIVRIALIVLAMVFSASPLPFSSVETQTFLICWWSGVMLLFLAMSDYFHVVRSVAYLSLWQALQIEPTHPQPSIYT